MFERYAVLEVFGEGFVEFGGYVGAHNVLKEFRSEGVKEFRR